MDLVAPDGVAVCVCLLSSKQGQGESLPLQTTVPSLDLATSDRGAIRLSVCGAELPRICLCISSTLRP